MDYTYVRITANNLEYQTSEFRQRMKRFGIDGNFLERTGCVTQIHSLALTSRPGIIR